MSTSLCLNTYTPNFEDLRVKKRINDVLAWCSSLLVAKKRPRSVHHSEIRTVFGNRSKPLGRWLYSNLLAQTGGYTPGHHSYSYSLKEEGYEKLCTLMGMRTVTSAEVAAELYAAIISGDETPVYSDKGGRRYHPIQNVRKEDKKILFDGWWDYDIESCAATLVYQYALAHHRRIYPDAGDDPFPAVARYVNEKATVRQHIAMVAGVPFDKAKDLSQCLLFQAPLTPHHRCTIFRLLSDDRSRLERLKKDPYVRQLVTELKKMWQHAIWADLRERRTAMFAGVATNAPPPGKGKHRQSIFMGLERKVMDAIHDWCGSEQFPGILMHDGFISREDLDTEALQEYVLNSTGYRIVLKKERLSMRKNVSDD